MYHYAVPPQGYQPYYDYNTSATTSPSSSPGPDGQIYYIPQPYSTPTHQKHSRSASYNPGKVPGGWHSPVGYPSPSHYTKQPDFGSPPAKESVSYKGKARRYSTSASRGASGNYTVSYTLGGNTVPRRHASVQSQKQRIIVDSSDEAEDSPQYTSIKPRSGREQQKYAKLKANQRVFYDQVPVQADDSHQRNPPRRASESRPTTSSRTPTKKAAPPRREATAADAAKHHIPAGYALKNWDPTEAPVMLLGSVFDANSLGKWIYDWTVFHHGPAQPMTDIAGDLWLLLIKLAGKMKRADECFPRLRYEDDQETIEDFLEAGDRLWARLKALLKACEEYMWKVAKKEQARSGKKGATPTMGKNSGCEFVDSIFGRERKLEETEGLMQSIRLWNHRFDKNCEEILRHP